MNKQRIIIFLTSVLFAVACAPKATRLANKAEKQYNQAEYQLAIENYEQAIAEGYKKTPEANYKIAESYKRSNRIHEAEPYYKKALAGDIDEAEEANFWYACALKSNGKYENAKEQFQKYISMGTNFDLVNRAKNELKSLDVIAELAVETHDYDITNIEQLNTPDAEYSPTLSKGNLYFTTNRGVTNMHAATNTGFTDIWEFIFDGLSEFSGQAKALPSEVNTNNAHEATPVFTKDGKTMYFSRGNTGSRKGAKDVDIYVTKMVNGIWSEPKIVPICKADAWDSSPALSTDGTKLYFASNREGGNGGIDLYESTRDSTGNWGNVKNLGTPINTRGNDMFPYEDQHGVFYFSSDGHPSFGTLDLFKVLKDSNGVVTIKNLGKPINSSYDDFALCAIDSTTGYFSSNRPDGKGDDDIYKYSTYKNAIYRINGVTLTKEKPQQLIADAAITIINAQGDTVVSLTSDDKGQFKFDGEPDQEYTVVAQKDGYMLYKEKFSTVKKTPKDQLKPGDNMISMDLKVEMVKKAVGVVVVIDNVYYDFDKADIRPDAAIALNKVVDILKDNPDIKIELSSHTDSRGSADYNRKLSQRRADAAVNYIISKGIDKSRITAKGYGEDFPIIKNAKTEAEFQINRRTEFKITNVTNPNLKIIKKGQEDLIQKEGMETDSTSSEDAPVEEHTSPTE